MLKDLAFQKFWNPTDLSGEIIDRVRGSNKWIIRWIPFIDVDAINNPYHIRYTYIWLNKNQEEYKAQSSLHMAVTPRLVSDTKGW